MEIFSGQFGESRKYDQGLPFLECNEEQQLRFGMFFIKKKPAISKIKKTMNITLFSLFLVNI